MNEPPIIHTGGESREEVVEYRSPAVLPIVTLVLGCLSFLAVFKPLYWIVPIVAIALGLVALYCAGEKPPEVRS